MSDAPVTLWRNARLAMVHADGNEWLIVDDGAVITRGGVIAWLGAASKLPSRADGGPSVEREVDLAGALLTPGLIDAHTHLVYGGDRALEFERRLQGVSYEQIAREGGGIRSTVTATRAASDEALRRAATQRALALRADGVTTLEIKSGYGLSAEHEARMLKVARDVAGITGQTVRTTYLAAHAVPPEFAGRSDDYIDAACNWLPSLAQAGLVDAVDAFCDRIGFTPDQTRRMFEAARSLGLPVKLHAEQLSDQGGAHLAATFGALSCDHLEHLSDEGAQAMSAAGTVAMLLPGAYHFLRETKLPPIDGLRRHRVPMALATDHNPGSSPALSLVLMMNFACTLFSLTPLESFLGVTRHAARALGLRDRGELAVGQRADLAVWDLNHPREMSYAFGQRVCQRVILAGREPTAP